MITLLVSVILSVIFHRRTGKMPGSGSAAGRGRSSWPSASTGARATAPFTVGLDTA